MGKYPGWKVKGEVGSAPFGPLIAARREADDVAATLLVCSADDPELRKRFVLWSDAVSQLEHPGLAPILDSGLAAGGVPFAAVAGDRSATLATRRATDPPARIEVLGILLAVAEALAAAHAKGFLHGMLSPLTLLSSAEGRVRVVDVGLWWRVLVPSSLAHRVLTEESSGYLAPEQVQGREVDPRVDLFALGVLACDLLTGQQPFPGETVSRVFKKVLEEPAPRLSAPPWELPVPIAELVEGCLRKDPAERIPSCAVVAESLRRILDPFRVEVRVEAGEADTGSQLETIPMTVFSAEELRTPPAEARRTAPPVARRTPPPDQLPTPPAPERPSPTDELPTEILAESPAEPGPAEAWMPADELETAWSATSSFPSWEPTPAPPNRQPPAEEPAEEELEVAAPPVDTRPLDEIVSAAVGPQIDQDASWLETLPEEPLMEERLAARPQPPPAAVDAEPPTAADDQPSEEEPESPWGLIPPIGPPSPEGPTSAAGRAPTVASPEPEPEPPVAAPLAGEPEAAAAETRPGAEEDASLVTAATSVLGSEKLSSTGKVAASAEPPPAGRATAEEPPPEPLAGKAAGKGWMALAAALALATIGLVAWLSLPRPGPPSPAASPEREDRPEAASLRSRLQAAAMALELGDRERALEMVLGIIEDEPGSEEGIRLLSRLVEQATAAVEQARDAATAAEAATVVPVIFQQAEEKAVHARGLLDVAHWESALRELWVGAELYRLAAKQAELLRQAARVSADRSQERERALLLAVEAGDGAAVAELLAGGDGSWADAEQKALRLATALGSAPVTRVLLERLSAGPDLGALLLEAAAAGQPDLVAVLLDLGAELETRDPIGRTPLLQAAVAGHPLTVRLLLDRGADRTARDDLGRTARELAENADHPESAAVLDEVP